MAKRKIDIHFNKYLFNLIVFVVLFIISIIATVSYLGDTLPTVVTARHPLQGYTALRDRKLLKNDFITQEFIAFTDRLGSIDIKFNTFDKTPKDTLIFRLRRKGDRNWYYENTYNTDQFDKNSFFPFGFPVIPNSKNITYIVEIQSVRGTMDDSVSINPFEQSFLSRYSYPKSYLFQNKSALLEFLSAKIISVVRNITIFLFCLILFVSVISKRVYLRFLKIFIHENIRTGEKVNLSFKQERSNYNWMHNLILKSLTFISFLILYVLFLLVFNKDSEAFEWQTYIATSWAVILYGYCADTVIGKLLLVTSKALNLLIVNLVTIFGFLFFLYMKGEIPNSIIWLLTLALIPILIVYTVQKHSGFSTQASKSEKSLRLFEYIVVNIILITVVCGFFITNLRDFHLNQTLVLITLSILFTLTTYFVKFHFQPSAKIYKLILFATFTSLAIIFIYITQKPPDYYHYSYYLGPVSDVIKGKSLLIDTPSQYGYLSIHFIAFWLDKSHLSLEIFNFINEFIFAIYFLITSFIFYKITKNLFSTLICSLIFSTLQTVFSHNSSTLPPSIGPLRFGPGLVILFVILFVPVKIRNFIGSLLCGLFVFWSIETAIYIIPAWVTYLFVSNYQKSRKLGQQIRLFINDVFILFISTLLIGSGIIGMEYLTHHQIPNFNNYVEYALAYKNGFGAMAISTFDNHYLVILINIISAITVLACLKNNKKSIFLYPLVYLLIHNMAIFSYFVSRSHENNIVNIFGFSLIEIALIYKIISEHYGTKMQNIKLLYLTPLVLFLILYAYRTSNQYNNQKYYYYHDLPNNLSSLIKDRAGKSFISFIYNKYKFGSADLILLDQDNDTQMLASSEKISLLPLNPLSMTTLLPNWQQKYLYPRLVNIPAGTVIITNKKQSESLNIWSEIDRRYRIQKVGTEAGLDIEVISSHRT